MPEIYLDTCVWGRPFDKPTEKITREENALYEILDRSGRGEVKILGSVVLDYEASRIRDPVKREDIQRTIAQFESRKIRRISGDLREEIIEAGFKPMDASHLAVAIDNSEYFITVDMEILNKRKRIEKRYGIRVMSPIEFVKEIR